MIVRRHRVYRRRVFLGTGSRLGNTRVLNTGCGARQATPRGSSLPGRYFALNTLAPTRWRGSIYPKYTRRYSLMHCASMFAEMSRNSLNIFPPACWADDGAVFVFRPPRSQAMAHEQPPALSFVFVGDNDPAHQVAPDGLLQPCRKCDINGWGHAWAGQVCQG